MKITLIHADNEFRAMEDMIDDKFKTPFNFSAPDKHVPDIERDNQMLAERYRCEYHRLSYDLIP